MPEPNTVTAPPGGPDPQDGSTAGWVSPPGAASAHPDTRTEVSTSGPHHPHRLTYSDDTERVASLTEPDRLPEIPGFQIEGVLGHGGMGVVYRAVDLGLGRAVALKVIYPRGRHVLAVRERFEREVRSLAAIDHRNIVPVYHAGNWHGFPFFTMKLVPGGPLSRQLHRFVGKPRECAALVAKVARAVQALHDIEVIHRDLKPLNILLDDGDEPLVADFGLAKWLDDPDSGVTVTGGPIGTRQYMSPEQTLGRRCDYSAGCDIWALGVVLHEMLGGTRPFPDCDDTELFDRIQHAEPLPLPDSVPPELAAVTRKCLEKLPGDRYVTAAAVADDLENWRDGRPVSVARTHAPRRPRPRLIAAALCGVLSLIALPAVAVPRAWLPGAGDSVPAENRTVAERLAAGQKVKFTDDKGKLLVPGFPIPGFELPTITDAKTREVAFTTRRLGMHDLADEVLPLPVRLEADVTLAASDPLSMAGFYVVRRHWEGAGLDHQSCVRFIVRAADGPVPADQRTMIGHADAVWFQPGGVLNACRLDHKEVVVKAPRAIQTTVRVSVRVEHDRLTATFGGVEGAPVEPHQLLTFLRKNIVRKPDLAWYPFNPPAFGTGIGITVGHSEAVIRNMTLTRERR